MAKRNTFGTPRAAMKMCVVWNVFLFAAGGCDPNVHSDSLDGHMPKSGPIATFDRLRIDLGEIAIESPSDFRDVNIPVKNTGDGPLVFCRMVMSCGCTTAQPGQPEILPGDSGVIRVRLNITAPGEKQVRITVYSNEVPADGKNVAIHWNAIAPIAVQPDEIQLGRLLPGGSATASVKLIYSKFGGCSQQQLSVFEGFESAHDISAKLAENATQLKVVLNAGHDAGEFVEFLPLQLTDCWRKSIKIPVRWTVASNLTATPNSMFVGTVAPSSVVKRTFILRSIEPHVSIMPIFVKDGNSDCVLESEAFNSRTWKSSIKLTAPEIPGPFFKEILLQLGDMDVKLTISGFVK